jgi:hypothetical protein
LHVDPEALGGKKVRFRMRMLDDIDLPEPYAKHGQCDMLTAETALKGNGEAFPQDRSGGPGNERD